MSTFKLYLVYMIMPFLPATRLFGLKRCLLRLCGARIGKNVRIVSSARFYLTGNLTIGDNTWIGHDVLIIGGDANVRIGANCDIAPRVLLTTGSHRLFVEAGRAAGEGYSTAITIEDGAWMGASATILGGVTVGSSSVVAAGALVRENVPNRTVVGGVPACELPFDTVTWPK